MTERAEWRRPHGGAAHLAVLLDHGEERISWSGFRGTRDASGHAEDHVVLGFVRQQERLGTLEEGMRVSKAMDIDPGRRIAPHWAIIAFPHDYHGGAMSESARPAFVLRPGEGRPIDMGGFSLFVKADEQATGGDFSLLETDEPAGFGPPLHIHHDAAEAFYVLDGEYTMIVDDQRYACPAGSFIYIPAGLAHTFQVGPLASRKLNLFTPAAMVGYFDELSEATRTGPVGPERVAEIGRRYAMEVLGPIPEGYL